MPLYVVRVWNCDRESTVLAVFTDREKLDLFFPSELRGCGSGFTVDEVEADTLPKDDYPNNEVIRKVYFYPFNTDTGEEDIANRQTRWVCGMFPKGEYTWAVAPQPWPFERRHPWGRGFSTVSPEKAREAAMKAYEKLRNGVESTGRWMEW